METVFLHSRLIARADFDRDAHVLFVQLTNGQIERHKRVSEKQFVALVRSSSPGNYYLQHIIPFYRRRYFRQFALGLVVLIGMLVLMRFLGFLG